MLDKIIFYSFAALLLITPLFWTSFNYELFEFNKMLLVYFLTIIITGAWLLKWVNNKSLNIRRSPLDIPILLFLGANILSTIFSIDQHTSIWGYYSRSNGGLLSTISYTLLYFALTANINKEQLFKLLKIGLLGGFLTALYAIPEHFGVSPSCVILHGQFNADCWIQDVQSRVFATLGQPNWLAAYMVMLIFPALYFFLTSQNIRDRIKYFTALIAFYLAFTFTYSRGATLGFIVGIVGFILLGFWFNRQRKPSKKADTNSGLFSPFVRKVSPIIITFLLINIIFGSALTRFQLTNFLPKKSPINTSASVNRTTAGVTQLENGGTESGQIRLIVWKGALDIFKHYPLFGSGVETFAYSYYQFRPASHNLVSEWDFLYNKAHNEFLNYLATTGIIGFGTYVLMILVFIVWSIKKIVIARSLTTKQSRSDSTLSKTTSPMARNDGLLILVLLASYISYLVQNFFGFSVVIIAVLFYLIPAIAFISTDATSEFKTSNLKLPIFSIIYKRAIYVKAVQLILLLVTCYLLLQVITFWQADRLFSEGEKASELGNAGRSYNYLSDAVKLRNFDPLYRSELGYAAAAASLALSDDKTQATLSAQLKDQAVYETDLALAISPKNTSLWRTAIRTYFQLAGLDEKFNQKTIDTIDKTISLAPTDAKLYYNKAVILGQLERPDEAILALNKAIELKSNYREAYLALGLFYFDKKDYAKAVSNMDIVLKLVPNDPEALKQLNDWGQQGIATSSANQ